jgi:hypothetical protein
MRRSILLGIILLGILVMLTACNSASTQIPVTLPSTSTSGNTVPTDTALPTTTALPTATPTHVPTRRSTATPTLTATPIDMTCLGVTFVTDVTVPDDSKLDKGTTFVKTWRVKNSGTCDWPATTVLAFVSGNQLGAAKTVPIGAVKVGATTDMSINMTTPNEDTLITSLWQLQVNGKAIGNVLYSVPIIVGNPPRRITGTIMWWTTPLPGARIELRQSMDMASRLISKTTSNNEGQFIFENPADGDYAIFAYAPDQEYWPMTAYGVTVKTAAEMSPIYLAKKIEMLEPASNATVSMTPTLRWKSFPGVTKYQWIVNDAAGQFSSSFQTVTGTSVEISSTLKPGKTYCYVVQAWVEDIPIANSRYDCFKVRR